MSPFALVIFGITGNLAQSKLLPAIDDLKKNGLLPPSFTIIGVGRKKITGDFDYIQGDLNDSALYEKIKHKTSGMNKLFYLATYPELYGTIFRELKKADLHHQRTHSVRLIIEKPFGSNLATSKRLNTLLLSYFNEDQIYRIDHYLGKETLQNILTFRFGNSIFEHLMNYIHIDHIQITSAEDFGILERGGYYDAVGAIRDTGQNHLLQMLALATMDPPKRFTNEDITRERINILSHLVPLPTTLVLGQYNGYKEEGNVSPLSNTETFFAFKTHIKTKRFKDVPIYIRGGKKLKRTVSEVVIVFKEPRFSINKDIKGEEPNALIYRIQPNEGIIVKMLVKSPGHFHTVEPTYMQFCYRQLGKTIPSPYERLLYDAIEGDQTFFNDAPEIEAQWKFVDSLDAHKLPVHSYKPGTWGPKEADEMIQEDGREWVEPSLEFCRL